MCLAWPAGFKIQRRFIRIVGSVWCKSEAARVGLLLGAQRRIMGTAFQKASVMTFTIRSTYPRCRFSPGELKDGCA